MQFDTNIDRNTFALHTNNNSDCFMTCRATRRS